MRSTFQKFGLIGSGVMIGILISLNFSALAEKVTASQLPIDDCDHFCQWLLESFSYNKQTVMLAPATGFYSTEGIGKNQVRLAYVLNLESINAAMDCLEKALMEYPGRIEKTVAKNLMVK